MHTQSIDRRPAVAAWPDSPRLPSEASDSDTTSAPATPDAGTWGAVASMGMCVALLIAAEFMPVSLLTPIARDLGATVGMAGQAISVSGLFAVATSLFIATFAARFDRRHVLVGLTGVMLASLVLIALAPNYLGPGSKVMFFG